LTFLERGRTMGSRDRSRERIETVESTEWSQPVARARRRAAQGSDPACALRSVLVAGPGPPLRKTCISRRRRFGVDVVIRAARRVCPAGVGCRGVRDPRVRKNLALSAGALRTRRSSSAALARGGAPGTLHGTVEPAAGGRADGSAARDGPAPGSACSAQACWAALRLEAVTVVRMRAGGRVSEATTWPREHVDRTCTLPSVKPPALPRANHADRDRRACSPWPARVSPQRGAGRREAPARNDRSRGRGVGATIVPRATRVAQRHDRARALQRVRNLDRVGVTAGPHWLGSPGARKDLRAAHEQILRAPPGASGGAAPGAPGARSKGDVEGTLDADRLAFFTRLPVRVHRSDDRLRIRRPAGPTSTPQPGAHIALAATSRLHDAWTSLQASRGRSGGLAKRPSEEPGGRATAHGVTRLTCPSPRGDGQVRRSEVHISRSSGSADRRPRDTQESTCCPPRLDCGGRLARLLRNVQFCVRAPGRGGSTSRRPRAPHGRGLRNTGCIVASGKEARQPHPRA
jgi:hypothetical protein